MSTSTDLTLVTEDGFALGATHFQPNHALTAGDPQFVLMAGATGVPQKFYRRFCRYVADQGYHALSLDYRGLGRSRPPSSLRGFRADYMDWAERDIAAALDWALERGQVSVVGHSFGGHAFGLLPRANETRGLYTFATGAGWSGYMPAGERMRVELMWKLLGPVLTSALGYLPGKILGGEDLPLGVYRQWRRWCQNPRYWFDDPSFDRKERFSGVRVPVIFSNASDDLWALPASAAAFQSGYTQAPRELLTYTPKELGLAQVGHMGYFRSNVGEVLWPRVLAWLESGSA
jgi:predicted alpha/beta hydrolase